jgi:hypothetical protein
MASQPPPPDDTPSASETRRGTSARRVSFSLHASAQIALILVLVVIANYLSIRHFQRWDLTAERRHSLDAATLNLLEDIDQDIDIIVSFNAASPFAKDVRSLAESYQRQRPDLIDIEFIDPAREPARAADLKASLDVPLEENALVVRSGDLTRVIPPAEMRVPGPDHSEELPQWLFRGEDALSSAILALSSGDAPKAYFLVGKGGRTLPSSGTFDSARRLAARQNISLHPLHLADVPEIPEDASCLILAGPSVDLFDRELALLRSYWARERGTLLILLDPEATTPLLDGFLSQLGVTPRQDRVLYAESTAAGPIKEYEVTSLLLPGSPITLGSVGQPTQFKGQSMSLALALEEESLARQQIKILPVLAATGRFWGETNFLDELPVFHPDTDHAPPIFLGATVERGHVADPKLRVASARLAVFSNPTLLDPATRLHSNDALLANSLNWMLDRDRLIGIAPRPSPYSRVFLTAQQSQNVIQIIFGMPIAALCFGFFIWSLRRQ